MSKSPSTKSLMKSPSIKSFNDPVLSPRLRVKPRKYANFFKVKEKPVEKHEKLPPIVTQVDQQEIPNWLDVSSEPGHQFNINRTPASSRKIEIGHELRNSCQLMLEKEALFGRNAF